MPIVNIGTAADLFLALDQSLTKHGIPWSNVFGFMSERQLYRIIKVYSNNVFYLKDFNW